MKTKLLALLLLLPAMQGATQTCSNLVTNGDFEAGGNNPGAFGFTSSYQYRSPGFNVVYDEGTYTLVGNPASVHNGFATGSDHTTGSGRSMVINGSVNPGTIVWQQTINVQPNTTYYFSTWVKNVVNGNNAILQFSINNSQIGSNFSATGLSVWQRFFTTWNSGSNTSAVIRLIDQQTAPGGNDFSIDDVFFTDVAPLTISSATATTASCNGAADGSISVTASGGVGPFEYSLNGGGFVAATGNPFTISGLNPGNYDIVIRDACGTTSPAGSATVGALDKTAPVISGCPDNISVNTGAGRSTCDQVVSWVPPTAADNCSAVTTTSSHNPGDAFAVGTTKVTYTFTDASNNSSTCSFDVTVADNTAPAVSGCPGDITVYTGAGSSSCGQVANWTPPTAVDNCGSVTTSSTHNSGDTFPTGTTDVSYTFRDSRNNSSTCSFKVTVIDNTPPAASCKNYTLTLSGGTGTVNPSDVDNSSTDNCGIVSRSVTPSSFTCVQAGTTVPVLFTVTDAANNTSTCTAMVTVRYKPTCSISVVPCDNTYTGGVPTDIYLGYGPQCATINVAAGGGGSGFSYSWSGPTASLSCTTCANPVFTPTAPGTYTYVVTVTNSSGCATQCTVTFCVKDIRVPGKGNNNKVYICHAPPGNPANANTLSISVNAVPSHLSGHSDDRLGSCDQSCGSPMARMAAGSSNSSRAIDDEVKVYPNPNTGIFSVDLPYIEDQAVITVTDVAGKLIQRQVVRDGDGNRLTFNLGGAAKGLYLVQVAYSDHVVRTKLIVQ